VSLGQRSSPDIQLGITYRTNQCTAQGVDQYWKLPEGSFFDHFGTLFLTVVSCVETHKNQKEMWSVVGGEMALGFGFKLASSNDVFIVHKSRRFRVHSRH
jgi:hypothetical protein